LIKKLAFGEKCNGDIRDLMSKYGKNQEVFVSLDKGFMTPCMKIERRRE